MKHCSMILVFYTTLPAWTQSTDATLDKMIAGGGRVRKSWPRTFSILTAARIATPPARTGSSASPRRARSGRKDSKGVLRP
jgi:hypothetical protein